MPPIDEPSSPRTLKGESIRSLRELLRASLSSSSLEKLLPPPPELLELKKEVKEEEEKQPQEDTVALQQAQQESSRRAADQVRKEYLENLGIQKQVQNSAVPPTSTTTSFEPWGESYTTSLNDAGKGKKTSTSAVPEEETTPSQNDNDNNMERKIHFDPIVQVHPIPSFRVYSYRIQQTIWTNAVELADHVARNALEFSYEHWDPNQVLDEESGLIWHEGEWIHPVHFAPVEYEDDEEEEDKKEAVDEAKAAVDTEEELWKQTCQRLGIQPAEFYHSIPGK